MSDERKPLFSYTTLDALFWHRMGSDPMPLSDHQVILHMQDVAEAYEHLITSGKLRVVEEVNEIWAGNGYYRGCSGCDASFTQRAKFCPGCGNKIKR
jgi:hypothetical protein